ncbi:MAG: patatin-like phospholipase family protein [Actinomycetota bacterium]|nr:patatin-like phospholipase family protein [Actinomycetota bacterium]
MAARTAFVLGGARNLGAMQVGMLGALVDAGITPDLVLGCSVGAINGAAVAADPTPEGVRRLEAMWRRVGRSEVWPTSPARSALALMRRGVAINHGDGLRRVVEAAARKSFQDLAVPFACVATALPHGTERWFDRGPLVPAVLASAALPALLPPVEIDGTSYLDGAIVNVVPLAKAVELGATRVFVLQIKDLGLAPPPSRRPLGALLAAHALSRNARFVRELRTVPAGVEVHVLPVVPWPRLRYDGFSRTAELVEAARSSSAAYLAHALP